MPRLVRVRATQAHASKQASNSHQHRHICMAPCTHGQRCLMVPHTHTHASMYAYTHNHTSTCTTLLHHHHTQVCMHACMLTTALPAKGSVLLCYGRATQQHTQHTQLALTHMAWQTHTAKPSHWGRGERMLAWSNLGINA